MDDIAAKAEMDFFAARIASIDSKVPFPYFTRHLQLTVGL